MKKTIKVILIILLGILSSILIMNYIFFGQYVINCTSFSNEYYEWFPYNEGDKLIFSNNKLSKTFIVKDYQTNHTEWYQSNLKCGCCEDNLNIILANQNDTLKIDFQNIDNKKSCFGTSLDINDSYIDLDEKSINFMNKQNRIRIEKYLIEKTKGITEFKLHEETWKLEKIIKSNSKNILTISNCN